MLSRHALTLKSDSRRGLHGTRQWPDLGHCPSGQMAGHEMPVAALLQFRRAFAAAGFGDRAAGVKMTTARRVHWARHIALQADPLALYLRVRYRHGGEQRLGIGVPRMAVEIARVSQFD